VATKATDTATSRGAAKAVPLTTDLWTRLLLEAINANLKKSGKRLIPITQNNIDNFERIMAAEVGGQDGGFLRDNNPLNVGTFCGAHGPLYGAARTVAPYGPDSRCSGGSVYLNVFATPEAGAKGTATYLNEYGGQLIKVLQQDGPTALFAAASPWGAGDLGRAPLKESSTKTVAARLAAGPGNASNPNAPAGPVAPPKLLTQAQLVKKLKALIASGHPQRWTAQETYSFQQLTAAQRKAVTQELESYAQTYNNPDTSIGADIGRGFDKTANAVKSTFSPFTKVLGDLGSAAFWKRIGIGAGGIVLIVAGTIVFLQSTKPVQAAESAAVKVV
jgi:hypothetical protein